MSRGAVPPPLPLDPAALGASVAAVLDEMVDTRRDLHAHPELSMCETRTTAVVRQRLASLGLREAGRPTPTGAVFDLDGGRPGRTVVLRADIDALPIAEEVDLPYRSLSEGVMHACGHDVHTASLLGVARILAARAGELPGRYRFIFQPAEEAICGAKAMVDGGVLDGLPDDTRLVGFHVGSLLPAGMVALRSGTAMAEANTLRLHLHGTGAHAAMPGSGGNVVLAAALLVRSLDDVVTGLNYHGTNCVCSAGVVRAGTANNVVPSHALIEGTLRTFTPEQTADALGRLRELCRRVGEDEGVTVELELTEHTPPVVNDPAVTAVVQQVATETVGRDHVVSLPPVAPSDDVSEMLERLGGCYFFVGGALPDGSSGTHHSPSFAVSDEALRVGATVVAGAALSLAAGAGGAGAGGEGAGGEGDGESHEGEGLR